MGDAAQILVRVGADTSDLDRGLSKASGAVSSLGSGLARSMKRLGVVGGAAMIAGFGGALVAAGNFEQQLNTLQAVSGASAGDMKRLGAEAKKLGADVKLPATSSKDAAEAMTELAKGGLKVGEVMKATRGTLQLSAAAGIANAEAATIQARALNAFNLEGSKATMVADLLAAASNESTAEISDLAQGFAMASAQFSMGGQSIQTLTTALALMADKGIAGSDAGTSLKTMLSRLIPTTKEAAAAQKQLGVDAFDSNGKMLPLRDIIGQYHQALVKLNPEQRQTALQAIFGADAIRAANIVLGEGVRKWDEMNAAVTKGGDAQRLAEAKTKGFKGALEGFKSTVETLSIELGSLALGPATKAIAELTKFVSFVDRIRATKGGIKVKFDVAVDGLEALKRRVETLLFGGNKRQMVMDADLLVKPRTVKTEGIVDKLGEELSRVNWASVAGAVSNGIATALSQSGEAIGPLIGALANLFTQVIKQTDWTEVGRDVARGLVEGSKKNIEGMFKGWGKLPGETDFLRMALSLGSGAAQTLWGSFSSGNAREAPKATRESAAAFGGARVPFNNAGRTVGAGGVAGIQQGLSPLPATIQNRFAAGSSAAQKQKGAYSSAGSQLGASGTKGVEGGLQPLPGGVRTKVAAGATAAQGAQGQYARIGSGLGGAMSGGILGALAGLAGGLISRIVGAARAALGAAKAALGIASPSRVFQEQVGRPIGQGIILGFLLGTAELPSKISERMRQSLEAGRRAIEEQRDRFRTAFDRLAQDGMRAFDARTEAMLGRLDAKLQRWLANIDRDVKARMAAIDAEQRELTPAEQAIKDKEAAREQRRINEGIAEAEKELNEARARGDADAIAAAERRLQLALEEKELAELRAQAEAERKAKDEEAERKKGIVETDAEAMRASATAIVEEEKKQLQARRDLMRRHLEDQLKMLEEYLEKHPQAYNRVLRQIIGVLSSYGVTFKQSGKDLGLAFAEGMRESFDAVEKTAQAIAELVAKYLRLQSPAEKGPLSKLDSFLDKMGPTLARGLDVRGIARTLETALALPATAAVIGSGSAIAPSDLGGLAFGGGGRETIVVEVEIPVIVDGREVSRSVERRAIRHNRNNTRQFGAS